MLSESDIGRYHFRMTDNHDGGTFDCRIDFQSDLMIIESDLGEHARVSNILGKAQRGDLMNTLNRFRIFDLRSFKPLDGRLTLCFEGDSSGSGFRAVLPLKAHPQLSDFALYILSISQYIGLKDEIVEHWRTLIMNP